MKIRTDFVTNSSSSSFLLAYKDEADAIKQLTESIGYNEEALNRVKLDVQLSHPLTKERLMDILTAEADSHAYWVIHFGEGSWWNSDKPTWEKQWEDANPGKTAREMRESAEYQAEYKRLMDEFIADVMKDLKDKPYILELEYEDHSSLSAELEQNIMPNAAGVVRVFNHH